MLKINLPWKNSRRRNSKFFISVFNQAVVLFDNVPRLKRVEYSGAETNRMKQKLLSGLEFNQK